MARISTHVLDIAKGKPASGIAVELRFGGAVIASAVTNADGRTNEPILTADRIETGFYELVFQVTEYLSSSQPAFFDNITIRFGVAEPRGNYHVPLLLAPHGYSTYRGS
jgi:5-hydroxyisourate hydrolase